MDNNYLIERYLINLTENHDIIDEFVKQERLIYNDAYEQYSSHCPNQLYFNRKDRLIKSLCKLNAKLKATQKRLNYLISCKSKCSTSKDKNTCITLINDYIHHNSINIQKLKYEIQQKNRELNNKGIINYG